MRDGCTARQTLAIYKSFVFLLVHSPPTGAVDDDSVDAAIFLKDELAEVTNGIRDGL